MISLEDKLLWLCSCDAEPHTYLFFRAIYHNSHCGPFWEPREKSIFFFSFFYIDILIEKESKKIPYWFWTYCKRRAKKQNASSNPGTDSFHFLFFTGGFCAQSKRALGQIIVARSSMCSRESLCILCLPCFTCGWWVSTLRLRYIHHQAFFGSNTYYCVGVTYFKSLCLCPAFFLLAVYWSVYSHVLTWVCALDGEGWEWGWEDKGVKTLKTESWLCIED